MYFTAKQLHDYATERSRTGNSYMLRRIRQEMNVSTITPAVVKKYHKAHIDAIVNRDTNVMVPAGLQHYAVAKWYRPWDVVPALRDWAPPVGEFGIGIEVELGFNTIEDARTVASKVKNWRHITLDFEGGTHPIEATFPPMLYNKFGPRSQACRYLKLVAELNGYRRHAEGHCVGTHVNVSKGGHRFSEYNVDDVNDMLQRLTEGEKAKYFGRSRPYGYGNTSGKFVEWKLFNSTTDWKRLRQYVDVAVELTELCSRDGRVTISDVREALERGFNKHPLS